MRYDESYEYYIPPKKEKTQENARVLEKVFDKRREKNSPEKEKKRPLAACLVTMLPRTQRLGKTTDFQFVFRNARSAKEDGILLKYVPTREENKRSRWGIVVSSKVAARATRRNRIKRILRQALQALSPQTANGFDGILIVLPVFSANTSKEAREILQRLFAKASLFGNMKHGA